MASNKEKKFQPEDYEPVKVDKWETTEVKNALDDAIKKFVQQEYHYVENFSLTDQKLSLCSVACGLSLFALVYDYLYPFPESKYILATCSVSYFIMMGVITLFSKYRERNIFMLALEKDKAGLGPDNMWSFSSFLPRFTETYTITLQFVDGKSKETRHVQRKESITKWFDKDGSLVMENFFRFFDELHYEVKEKKVL